jgi:hypothetical protein
MHDVIKGAHTENWNYAILIIMVLVIKTIFTFFCSAIKVYKRRNIKLKSVILFVLDFLTCYWGKIHSKFVARLNAKNVVCVWDMLQMLQVFLVLKSAYILPSLRHGRPPLYYNITFIFMINIMTTVIRNNGETDHVRWLTDWNPSLPDYLDRVHIIRSRSILVLTNSVELSTTQEATRCAATR